MSTPAELDEIVRGAQSTATATHGARQTLAQLSTRWGVRPFSGMPEEIRVDVAHGSGVEAWRRVEDGNTKAKHVTYELENSCPRR